MTHFLSKRFGALFMASLLLAMLVLNLLPTRQAFAQTQPVPPRGLVCTHSTGILNDPIAQRELLRQIVTNLANNPNDVTAQEAFLELPLNLQDEARRLPEAPLILTQFRVFDGFPECESIIPEGVLPKPVPIPAPPPTVSSLTPDETRSIQNAIAALQNEPVLQLDENARRAIDLLQLALRTQSPTESRRLVGDAAMILKTEARAAEAVIQILHHFEVPDLFYLAGEVGQGAVETVLTGIADYTGLSVSALFAAFEYVTGLKLQQIQSLEQTQADALESIATGGRVPPSVP